jgi:hypothetical protein
MVKDHGVSLFVDWLFFCCVGHGKLDNDVSYYDVLTLKREHDIIKDNVMDMDKEKDG